MRNDLFKYYFDRYVELVRDYKNIGGVVDCLRIAHNIGRIKEEIFTDMVKGFSKSPEFVTSNESDYDLFFSHLCKLYYRVEAKAINL